MNGDRLYFLAKDPHWTFIWWDIQQQNINQVKSVLGEQNAEVKFSLRVHDITGIRFDGANCNGFFDIEVTGGTDHWYLHIPIANRTYCVEAGFKTIGGRFFVLACSNPLSLPRDCPSEAEEESWSMIIF